LHLKNLSNGVGTLTDFFRFIKIQNFPAEYSVGDFLRIVGASRENGVLKIQANSIRRVFTAARISVKIFGFQRSFPPPTPFSRCVPGKIPVIVFLLVDKFPAFYSSGGLTILKNSLDEFIELNGERNLRIEEKQKWLVSDRSGFFSFVTGVPEIKSNRVYRLTNSCFCGPGIFFSRDSSLDCLSETWEAPAKPLVDLEFSSALELEREGEFSLKLKSGNFAILKIEARGRIFNSAAEFSRARRKILCGGLIKNCLKNSAGFSVDLADFFFI